LKRSEKLKFAKWHFERISKVATTSCITNIVRECKKCIPNVDIKRLEKEKNLSKEKKETKMEIA
jgi:hypothetical protein